MPTRPHTTPGASPVTQALDAATDQAPPLRVTYVVNHYPSVSHTFIRHEIPVRQHQGVRNRRDAIRGWADHLVAKATRMGRLPDT